MALLYWMQSFRLGGAGGHGKHPRIQAVLRSVSLAFSRSILPLHYWPSRCSRARAPPRPRPTRRFPGEPASDLYSSVTVGGVPVGVRKFAPVGLRTPPLHYARFAQSHGRGQRRRRDPHVRLGDQLQRASRRSRDRDHPERPHLPLHAEPDRDDRAPALRAASTTRPQWLMIFADPPASPAYAVGPGVYDVTTFTGIDRSGATLSTAGLQAAIDFVSTAAPPRVLFFPTGRYRTGQINMRSGVTLYLTSGAVLSGSTRPADYTAAERRPAASDPLQRRQQRGDRRTRRHPRQRPGLPVGQLPANAPISRRQPAEPGHPLAPARSAPTRTASRTSPPRAPMLVQIVDSHQISIRASI